MLEGFKDIGNEVYVLLISMTPVSELRGAIPFGLYMGLDIYTVFIISVLGNCLPIPILLWITRPVMAWLRKTKILSPLAAKLDKKTDKNRSKIMKYSAFGLFVFVAIPLPGTGAWSGAIAASMLDMRFKYALPSIACGVVAAGIIMCFGSALVQSVMKFW